ncbi:alcohol dehydrogenase family protein [Sciscionella sediminilitoris]|uniref:alcohol dehydrogenase family protein n=1 Tax=Sciscionella sediminilitoris TaxID=1445613 RepID=UPI000A6A2727|nr:alcohol dehydrogenase family protein [Sciscionella sp. SE31]
MIPEQMAAVVLTGHGGFDKLQYRTDVPTPRPGPLEVLIEVAAAGINNTDINTRVGWYSKTVRADTNSGGTTGFDLGDTTTSWSGAALRFPLIQGADVCGRIVAVGEEVSPDRIGERVVVRNMLRSYVDYRPFECWTLGSDRDGGFAQYVVTPSRETYAIESDLNDAELAALPCSYSTAENMLARTALSEERVLVTGASGGVGLAAVQLAKRRGATVIAVCSPEKAAALREQGADRTLDRDADLLTELGRGSIDVVLDLVGGPNSARLLDLLCRGGRYAVAGAIGGPVTEVDLRTVYLNDLSLYGCTFQEDEVFENLVEYVRNKEIRPTVARTYPLEDIVHAQQDFLAKQHVGNLILLPQENAQ